MSTTLITMAFDRQTIYYAQTQLERTPYLFAMVVSYAYDFDTSYITHCQLESFSCRGREKDIDGE